MFHSPPSVHDRHKRPPAGPASDWAFERVKAEIDLVVVQIETLHNTNFQTVQRRLGEARRHAASKKPVFVTAIDPGPGGSARCFEFAVQDVCGMSVLYELVSSLERAFVLAAPPTIRAIEFAVDFYLPAGSTDTEGAYLTAHLANRLYTGGRRARQLGRGTGNKTVHVDHADVHIVPDATTYFGHRSDDLNHKVYWKEKDCGVAIDESARRARVEVRVSGDVLLEMGLKAVADLASENFRKLLAHHFRFRRARQMSNPECTSSPFHGLLEKAGVGESHGMSSFDAYRRTRRGRLNKHSKLTQADRFMTRRVGDALDGLTDRLTKKSGDERRVTSFSMDIVFPIK